MDKRCKLCGATKPLDEFYAEKGCRDGRRPECEACNSAKRKQWYKANREKEIARVKGGGCAVCGKKPKLGKSLHVDHDHATGEVRGLLCFSCNAALGHLRDDPVRIDALMAYVLGTNPLAVLLAEIEEQLAS